MSTQEISDYDLLTEHFSYPPVSLLDDIINTVNVLADRALDSVERLLTSIPPANLGFSSKNPQPSSNQHVGDVAPPQPPSPADAAKAEIENGTHQLETLLNAAIDKNFDVFELYIMQNVLTVKPADRPYMKLAHYAGLDLDGDPAAAAEDRPTAESVTNLRRRLQASQRLHLALEAERARNEALLSSLRRAVGAAPSEVKREGGAGGALSDEESTAGDSAFGFLRDRGGLEASSATKPLTTTTEFTLSQLQALRSLSKSLRRILPEITAGVSGDGDDDEADSGVGRNKKRSWRRDRMDYVEGSSRKYLEKQAGLELGPQGDVRDGEWQGGGGELRREEVEGLERVVAILDRDRGETRTAAATTTRQSAEEDDEEEDDEMEDS